MPCEFQPTTSVEQYFRLAESSALCCVYFTATWCYRCKQVWTKIQGFPNDFPQILFLQVDLEATQELGELLDINTLPTFVLLERGVEVHRVEGVPQQRPARKLAQAIKQYLLGEVPTSGEAEH